MLGLSLGVSFVNSILNICFHNVNTIVETILLGGGGTMNFCIACSKIARPRQEGLFCEGCERWRGDGGIGTERLWPAVATWTGSVVSAEDVRPSTRGWKGTIINLIV